MKLTASAGFEMNRYIGRFRVRQFVYILLPLCVFYSDGPAGSAVDFDLPIDTTPINRMDPQYLTSYAPVLKAAREAVVAVHAARVVRVYRSRGIDPQEELLRRFFNLPAPQGRQQEVEERLLPQGLGSGVVISADGYIVTNNHLVSVSDGGLVDEVLVQLNDGRELVAEIVGRDPKTDLAVLKVKAADLPALSIADSDQLEVGDIVFAVGNPMGVGLTITQGIVSATERSNLSILGEFSLESFIQTDASINPGNSGGALVDAYGRLVGINTAILSRGGGSIGIGFAIPSSSAHRIALAIIQHGEVRRGMLGVRFGDLNDAYIEAFKAPGREGALVQSVIPNSPAERVGLRNGDIILSVNGVPVQDATALRLKIGEYAPAEEIMIGYFRDGSSAAVKVVLADPEDPSGWGAMRGELLEGVEVAVLDQQLRMEFGYENSLTGLVILSVAEDSPYLKILQPGAVISQINGKQPRSVAEGVQLLKLVKVSRLYIYFKGRGGYLAIRSE